MNLWTYGSIAHHIALLCCCAWYDTVHETLLCFPAMVDFGLSIDYSQERPVSAVGTLQYMAPEVVVCPTKSRPEENKVRQSFTSRLTIVKLWMMRK